MFFICVPLLEKKEQGNSANQKWGTNRFIGLTTLEPQNYYIKKSPKRAFLLIGYDWLLSNHAFTLQFRFCANLHKIDGRLQVGEIDLNVIGLVLFHQNFSSFEGHKLQWIEWLPSEKQYWPHALLDLGTCWFVAAHHLQFLGRFVFKHHCKTTVEGTFNTWKHKAPTEVDHSSQKIVH